MRRDDWVTVDEAVAMTGRSRPTIYRWRVQHRVRWMRVGRTLLFERGDVLQAEADTLPRLTGESLDDG